MNMAHLLMFPMVVALLFLAGCATADHHLHQRLNWWREAHPNRGGDCMLIAIRREHYYKKLGILATIKVGEFKGKGHAWCEYYDEFHEEWLVDDPAIWYINNHYPRHTYQSAGVCDYQVYEKKGSIQ